MHRVFRFIWQTSGMRRVLTVEFPACFEIARQFLSFHVGPE
jgi:hypothetical protein